MKIKEALSKAIVYLNERKFTDPLYESRLILSLILEKDISFIYAYLDLELEPKDEEKFFQILKMRQSGQPLQYILEETYFMGKKFKINRGVLIPRKETEISVEVITDIIKKNKCKSFLEIGCGSGIVTIMVNLLTNINCSCLDISDLAIENTKTNIKNLGAKVQVFKSNLFENIEGKFDIIYSNPPYIKTGEIKNLQDEVKNFEPISALDGGESGLEFYKKIIKQSTNYLNDNGFLIFEIGYDQKDSIENLMIKDFNIYFKKDLQGYYRVAVGKRRC